MKARNVVIPLGLFGLAFASSWYALREGAPVEVVPVAATAASLQRLAVAAVPPVEAARLVVNAGAGVDAARGVGGRAVDRFAAAAPASAAPLAVEPELPAASPDIEQAADAIVRSTDKAERVRAVLSVAQSAHTSRDIARARTALKDAAADEDPDIAQRAQEQYDRLVERLER